MHLHLCIKVWGLCVPDRIQQRSCREINAPRASLEKTSTRSSITTKYCAHSTGNRSLSVSFTFSGPFSHTTSTLLLSIQSSWPGASS